MLNEVRWGCCVCGVMVCVRAYLLLLPLSGVASLCVVYVAPSSRCPLLIGCGCGCVSSCRAPISLAPPLRTRTAPRAGSRCTHHPALLRPHSALLLPLGTRRQRRKGRRRGRGRGGGGGRGRGGEGQEGRRRCISRSSPSSAHRPCTGPSSLSSSSAVSVHSRGLTAAAALLHRLSSTALPLPSLPRTRPGRGHRVEDALPTPCTRTIRTSSSSSSTLLLIPHSSRMSEALSVGGQRSQCRPIGGGRHGGRSHSRPRSNQRPALHPGAATPARRDEAVESARQRRPVTRGQ